MKKKIDLVFTERRRRSDFMGRVGDIFERKFDGFPASVPIVQVNPKDGFRPNPTLIVDDEGLKQVDDVSPCDEQPEDSVEHGTYTRTLTSGDGGATYEYPVTPVDYVISVWRDGLLQVVDRDYTVLDDILSPTVPWADSRVVSRFVV